MYLYVNTHYLCILSYNFQSTVLILGVLAFVFVKQLSQTINVLTMYLIDVGVRRGIRLSHMNGFTNDNVQWHLPGHQRTISSTKKDNAYF